MSLLKEISQKRFFFDIKTFFFEGNLAQKLRFSPRRGVLVFFGRIPPLLPSPVRRASVISSHNYSSHTALRRNPMTKQILMASRWRCVTFARRKDAVCWNSVQTRSETRAKLCARKQRFYQRSRSANLTACIIRKPHNCCNLDRFEP